MIRMGIYLPQKEVEQIKKTVSDSLKQFNRVEKLILYNTQALSTQIALSNGLPNGKYSCDLRTGEIVRL